MAWFITGLFVAAPCQLTRIAPHLPWDGDRDSIVQRLRRVLMNPRLEVRTLYTPTVRYLLRGLNNAARGISPVKIKNAVALDPKATAFDFR